MLSRKNMEQCVNLSGNVCGHKFFTGSAAGPEFNPQVCHIYYASEECIYLNTNLENPSGDPSFCI
jgi:hypothetical protein